MKNPLKTFDKVVDKIAAWAKARPDIRSAVVLGSRARTETPADEWSDLDIVFGVTDPSLYTQHTDWLENIDNVKIMFMEPVPISHDLERRVLFECGLDVDFSFVVAALMPDAVLGKTAPGFSIIWERGYRILFDKDGIIPPFNPSPAKAVTLCLTEAEFTAITHDFWYHAVWTAKKLRRGEVWVSIRCCDYYMKRLLLKMLEYQARLKNGEKYDTWFEGRFLESWADRRIVRELEKTFAHYDKKDIRRALLATMDLFRLVTREISEKSRYPYPVTADEYATNLVGSLLPE